MSITIRREKPCDRQQLLRLLYEASETMPFADVHETFYQAELRQSFGLSLSLVACDDYGELLGCIAVSSLMLSNGGLGWVALGYLAVREDYQGYGIGAELVKEAKSWMKSEAVEGCVVAGSSAFYGQLGWQTCSHLQMPGVPIGELQVLLVNAREEPEAFVNLLPLSFGSVHRLPV